VCLKRFHGCYHVVWIGPSRSHSGNRTAQNLKPPASSVVGGSCRSCKQTLSIRLRHPISPAKPMAGKDSFLLFTPPELSTNHRVTRVKRLSASAVRFCFSRKLQLPSAQKPRRYLGDGSSLRVRPGCPRAEQEESKQEARLRRVLK
jgi:hypothetical protein